MLLGSQVWGVPLCPVGRILCASFHWWGPGVRAPVGESRSCKLCGMAPPRGGKTKNTCANIWDHSFIFLNIYPEVVIARSYGNSTKFLRNHHFFSYNSFPAIVFKGSSSSHLYTSCFLIVAVFGYHLWRNVYANPLPILKSGSFWLSCSMSSLISSAY